MKMFMCGPGDLLKTVLETLLETVRALIKAWLDDKKSIILGFVRCCLLAGGSQKSELNLQRSTEI